MFYIKLCCVSLSFQYIITVNNAKIGHQFSLLKVKRHKHVHALHTSGVIFYGSLAHSSTACRVKFWTNMQGEGGTTTKFKGNCFQLEVRPGPVGDQRHWMKFQIPIYGICIELTATPTCCWTKDHLKTVNRHAKASEITPVVTTRYQFPLSGGS